MIKNIILLTKYGLLIILGVLIVLLASQMQHTAQPQVGEYYYSSFLRHNFTILTACLYTITGLMVGYFSKWNAWISGLSLVAIFPLVSFYEATVYHGSHNLIPLELVVFLSFAFPAIAGIYLGRYIAKRNQIRH